MEPQHRPFPVMEMYRLPVPDWFEWPHRPPSAACLFPEDRFDCLCCFVNAHSQRIVQQKQAQHVPFLLSLVHRWYNRVEIYLGKTASFYACVLDGNLLTDDCKRQKYTELISRSRPSQSAASLPAVTAIRG